MNVKYGDKAVLPNLFLRFALLLFLPFVPLDSHAADFVLPGPIINLSASQGPAAGEVRLSWTAQGDDFESGDITGGRFAAQYGAFGITFDLNQAQVIVSSDMVMASQQTYIIRGLSPGVTYYFGLWVRDEVPVNWSGVSNTANAWAQLGTVPAPAAPTGFSGQVLSSGSISLNWTDNAANEQGYRVKSSTSATVAVLPVDTTYYIQSGLVPNTTYYRAVEVFNSSAAIATSSVTLRTLSAPSSGTYVTSRSSWSVAIAWQANGNPAITRWGIERSTNNFTTYQVLKSSTDAYTVRSYLDAGLLDLSTYYYRVNSFNEDSLPSGYGAAISTVTLSTPAAPGGFSGAVLGASSVAWTWTDNSYNEAGYRLITSTGGSIAALPAGTTAYVETGLGGNQLCARIVEAYNGAGYAVSASTTYYTLGAPPSGIYVVSRSSWEVGIAWQANTNSAATRWGVERSTDNFATYQVLKSSTAAYTVRSYPDTGLLDLTTYYYRVNSFNEDSLPSDYGAIVSTVTLSTPAAPGGFSALAASTYSIRFTWTDNAYNEEGYRILGSTGTLYVLPSGTTSYIETGLTANTSYYRVVEAYNGNGSAGAPYTVVYTSAAVPSGLYIMARSSWSVLIGWQGGGNPDGTSWGIERSLVSNFVSSVTLTTFIDTYTALTYLDTGLANLTRYYYHVRGFNGDGFSTAYSLAVSTLTMSTPTLPSGFSGTALGQDSIRWAWTDASDNEEGFNLRNNTGGLVAAKGVNSNFHSEYGLGPNLPYVRYLEVYNGAGSTATAKIAVNTLSAPPIVNGSVTVTPYSAHVVWNPNGNPAGTFWGIERSTDAFATSQVLKVFEDYYSATDYLDTTLNPETLYYYRVKSYNGAGIASSTSGVVAMTQTEIIPDVTPPAAVTDLAATQGAGGGEIQLSWTSPGDDVSAGDISSGSFKVQYLTNSTGTFSIAAAQLTVSSDMAAGSTQTYVVSGLSPGVVYYRSLWVRDETGANWSTLSNKTTAWAQIPPIPVAPVSFLGEAISSSSIRWTWSPGLYHSGYKFMAPSGILTGLAASATVYVEQNLALNTSYTRYIQGYNFSGSSNSAQSSVYTFAAPPAGFGPSQIGYSSVTVAWTPNGNLAGALYRLQYWGVQSATTTMDLTALSAHFPGLAEASTYYFRVGAVNHAGTVAWFPSDLTVVSLGLPRVSADLPLQSGIHLELAQASGLTQVDIPPETFNEAIVISLKTPLAYPSDAAPRPGKPAAAGLEILTDRQVQPGKPVVIIISYSDADVAGLNPARLAIARFDTTRGAWVVLPSSADPPNHRVTATTTHFSLFRLFEVNPAQTVLSPRVYPNPFRPSLGHTGVNFDGLPAEAVLKIYAFDGSKVRVITCNASGAGVWDAKNSSGRDVASGLYFVYAEKGSDSKIMTVVVQR